MDQKRVLTTLTCLNLLLLISIVISNVRPALASSQQAQILRGRGLEIIDERGRVRASIEILPADSTVRMPDGTRGYPATVLFRLRSQAGNPNVKIEATDDGSGMVLGGSARAESAYVQVLARGPRTSLKLSAQDRAPRVIVP